MADIYVTAVKVPVSRTRTRHGRDCFQDLVPWADPYIVGLVESLQRGDGRLPPAARDNGERNDQVSATLSNERRSTSFQRPSGGRF